MKNIKKMVLPLLLFLCIPFLAALMHSARDGVKQRESVSCYENGNGFWTYEEMEAAVRTDNQQEITGEFAAWGQKNEQTIGGQEIEREITESVLFVYGPAHLVVPGGRALDPQDETGCLIGKDTAQKLFGSSEVTGRRVIFEEKTYGIRGVLEETSEALVIPCGQDDTNTLNRINIKKPADTAGWNEDEFFMRTGLLAEQVEFMFVTDAADMLCALPWFAMLIFLLCFLAKWMKDSAGRLAEQILIAVLGVFGGFIFFKFCFVVPEFLKTYTPGQWSDLDYLVKFIKHKNEALQNLTAMEKTVPDQVLFRFFGRIVVCALAAIGCFIVGCRLLVQRSPSDSRRRWRK